MGKMRFGVSAGCGLAVVLLAAVAYAQYYEDTMDPEALGLRDIPRLRTPAASYVGNDVCRLCHEAAYQTWLGSGHARAFVPMRSMMAAMMGKEQGITACCPAKSGKCLTCHATAQDVAAEYRGPGFRMGEGVACEKCHGPGGDHVRAAETGQTDVPFALKMPTRASCERCHAPQASHAALELPPFDARAAWKRIAHPYSDERPEDELEPEELGIWRLHGEALPAATYAGSEVCAQCHAEPYAIWSASPHAAASRALRSQMAVMMNMKADMNVVGGAMKNGVCLSCHATAHDAPARYRQAGFRMYSGVGCEKCHGPAGNHVAAMRAQDHSVARLGLARMPTEQDCMACHKRQKSHQPLGRPRFDFEGAWRTIAH